MTNNGKLVKEAMDKGKASKPKPKLTFPKPTPVYDKIPTPGAMREQAITAFKGKQAAAFRAFEDNKAEVRPAGPKRSAISKALAIAGSPVTAASYLVRGQKIPENFERGSTNIYDIAGSILNPFSAIDAVSKTPESIRQGDYLGAAMNVADIIPGVVTIPKSARTALNQIDKLTPVGKKLDVISKEGKALGLTDFEIAQRQLDEVGITSNQRQGYVPGLSDLARKYITPYGYSGLSNAGSKFTETIRNIKKGGVDYNNHLDIDPARADAWSMYLGFPQKHKTFRMAETVPVNHRAYSKDQLKDMDIYSLNNEALITDEIMRGARASTPSSINNAVNNLKAESFVDVDPVGVMGNFNARFTNNGLQYNDIWDLEPSIAPVNFLPNKLKNKLDNNPLFFTKIKGPGGKLNINTPRKFSVNVSKFFGKPYLSHGHTNLTSQEYRNNLVNSLEDAVNYYSKTPQSLTTYAPKVDMLKGQIDEIKNMNDLRQNGGPIIDPRGQWAHPGADTIVPTPNGQITMQGVPYSVYGQDETGYGQMMYPGGEYQFPGQMVYETPMMSKGGQHGGLDRWFAEKWVDVKTGKDCGRQEGESRKGYPACRPSRRVSEDTPKTASELSSSEREKFKRSKTSSERINYQHRRKEYGGEQTESDMANKPNNPALWSRAKSLAKQKFDVYPSAYANGWAAKWYKGKGGTWRKAEYGMEVPMMAEGGKPEWLMEAQLKAQGYSGDALQQKMASMAQGGEPQNAGFQALPEAVQQKILDSMAYGGYMAEMAYGGSAQQAAIAIAMKKAGKKPKSMADGGEPNGEMALGQMAAVQDKMNKLLKFVKPNDNLDPWIASKLAVMDHSADAIADYMMYGPEAEEMGEMEQMKKGGYVVTRSNDRKGKTHKVTGPDGTVKYFGDSKLGQHPKDPERKKAFYARHKKNLDNNPYFRAFARATWQDGGDVPVPFSREHMQALSNEYDQFYAPPRYYSGDDGYDAFYKYKKTKFPKVKRSMGPGWLGSREEGMTMFKPGNQDQPPKKKQGVSYEYVNDYVEDGTFDADLGSHLLMLVRQKAKNQYKPNHLQQLYEAGGYIGQDGKRHMSSTPTWSGNAGYEMGGPIVGDEMEVTPEQLEQLRAQGYQFEII